MNTDAKWRRRTFEKNELARRIAKNVEPLLPDFYVTRDGKTYGGEYKTRNNNYRSRAIDVEYEVVGIKLIAKAGLPPTCTHVWIASVPTGRGWCPRCGAVEPD